MSTGFTSAYKLSIPACVLLSFTFSFRSPVLWWLELMMQQTMSVLVLTSGYVALDELINPGGKYS